MPTYIIRAGKDGPVKIGRADDVEGRVILRRVPAWVQTARKRRRAQRSARKAERRGRK